MAQRANKPLEISEAEWQEIIQLRMVRERWGLNGETAAEFAATVYGVKFDFLSGSPGYVGDLFVLHGDSLSGNPVILVRVEGKLQPFYG